MTINIITSKDLSDDYVLIKLDVEIKVTAGSTAIGLWYTITIYRTTVTFVYSITLHRFTSLFRSRKDGLVIIIIYLGVRRQNNIDNLKTRLTENLTARSTFRFNGKTLGYSDRNLLYKDSFKIQRNAVHRTVLWRTNVRRAECTAVERTTTITFTFDVLIYCRIKMHQNVVVCANQ